MTPARRLRALELRRAPPRPAGARIAAIAVVGRVGRLDRRAPGCRPRRARCASASRAAESRRRRRGGSGARRGRRRPRRAGRSTSSTNVVSGSTSPATPRPPSTSWQKPWVVAIVAASKSASAAARRVAAQRDLRRACRSPAARRPRRAASGAPASARPRPCSAPTSRSRTRSRSSPVAMRVNVTSSSSSQRDAVGHVARGQRGDRVRLAGAGAGLEHGHAGRQRAADVERAGRSQVAHRSISSSCASSAVPQPARVAAEAGRSARVPVVALLVGPGPRASSSSNGSTPPSTSWCSARGPPCRSSRSTPTPWPPPRRGCRPRGRLRVGGGGLAGQRQRLAQPAVVEVGEAAEVLEARRAARRVAGERRQTRDGRRGASAPARRAADGRGLQRPLGVRGGQREQPHPGRQPVARARRASR